MSFLRRYETVLPIYYTEREIVIMCYDYRYFGILIVKLRQGSGKDGHGMALKAKGLKA